MDTTRFDPLEYLSILRRRRWWLIVPFVAAVAIGVGLALFLPKEYESSVTIAVSSPSMAPNLVGNMPTLDPEERTRAISQQLISRRVLERVAREESLIDGRGIDAIVALMRAGVRVSLPETGLTRRAPGAPVDTFIVTYTDTTPERARRVADRLAKVFVDEHSRVREARAEETSAFLGTQLQASQKRLTELEERLRQAKGTYMGRLPEQTPANLSMVTGLRQTLESTALGLRAEQDRLSMIERQIEQMKQGAADVAVPMRNGAAETVQARLGLLQRALNEARSLYTEKHPEIQRIQEEMTAARAELAAEQKKPAEDRADALTADPAYRQLLSDREVTRFRIRNLQRAEEQARAQINSYQSRVESAPMVEQALTSLNREYELEKTQYSQLSQKHQTSLVAEDMERQRGGEQFRVLYPAYLPIEPARPNQPRILMLAVLIGIFLGCAGAFGRDYFDRSVHDARVLQEEFDLPVLAEIPRLDRVA